MTDIGSRDYSPFHTGEQDVQRRVGVRDQAELLGRQMIRPAMPDQHREFFAGLNYVFVAIAGEYGRPNATVVWGEPGFVRAPDATRLLLKVSGSSSDPALEALRPGIAVGVLGLDLASRRRNRVNGVVSAVCPQDQYLVLEIAVRESFGNCPKYIQRRQLVASADTRQGEERAFTVPESTFVAGTLIEPARTLINGADTFFIASQIGAGGQQNMTTTRPGISADMSHRGGPSGFVRIVAADELLFPDYAGNRLFNTLGNLHGNKSVALLFIDFDTGNLLHLSGDAEILWNLPEQQQFPGAERLVRFMVDSMMWRPGAVPLRWRRVEKGVV